MRYRTYSNAGYSHDTDGPTRYGHHRAEAVAAILPPIEVDAADERNAAEATTTDAPGESRL